MSDEEGELADALFETEVSKIEPAVEGAEEGEDTGCVRAEADLGEDNRNDRLLEFVQLGEG